MTIATAFTLGFKLCAEAHPYDWHTDPDCEFWHPKWRRICRVPLDDRRTLDPDKVLVRFI